MALQPVGVGDEVLDELRAGRTRELLMLLQGKPVPEVQDPMNIQSGLSEDVEAGGDGFILDKTSNILSNNSGSTSIDGDYTVVSNPTIESFSNEFYWLVDDGEIDVEVEDTTNNNILSSASNSYSPSDTIDISDLGEIQIEIRVRTSDGSKFSSPWEWESRGGALDGFATDQFSAPTTEPTDFRQWTAIQARDVTEGGSTSPEHVEFEILDATDTVLNSTKIPKSEIADEPFELRNRVASVDAGADGQSDFVIPTTGDGGHYDLPILTAVSVKLNGSLLDSANWEFDPDTETVTIDTSNVTIASGDTVEIKYDFDVFDSTLQPRAYLSREDTSEDSPSISHFRYEYVI